MNALPFAEATPAVLRPVALLAFGLSTFAGAQENVSRFSIPDQLVVPGQVGVWFPVIGNFSEPVQGFQLSGLYDPGLLSLTEHTLAFTTTERLRPEIWEGNIGGGRFELGTIFDFVPPFWHSVLPPREDHVLVNLVFDVSTTAPPGAETTVELVDTGLPGNVELESSRVEIVSPMLTHEFFVRGDANGDGTTDITDAVRILNFLFLGGLRPPCPDAADVADRGQVDVSSAISLLSFLFLGGIPPRVPFPNAGLDPTPDGLPPCSP